MKNKIGKIVKMHLLPAGMILFFFLISLMITLWKLRQNAKVIPEISYIRDGLLWVGVVLSFLAWIYVLFRRIVPLLRSERWRNKICIVILSFFLECALVLGCAATLQLGLDSTLFEEPLYAKKLSPDRTKQAYIFKQIWMCGYSIYIRERGALIMQEQKSPDMPCDDQGKTPLVLPVWDSESKSVSLSILDRNKVR